MLFQRCQKLWNLPSPLRHVFFIDLTDGSGITLLVDNGQQLVNINNEVVVAPCAKFVRLRELVACPFPKRPRLN